MSSISIFVQIDTTLNFKHLITAIIHRGRRSRCVIRKIGLIPVFTLQWRNFIKSVFFLKHLKHFNTTW